MNRTDTAEVMADWDALNAAVHDHNRRTVEVRRALVELMSEQDDEKRNIGWAQFCEVQRVTEEFLQSTRRVDSPS